jgi:hypothetical protein
VIQRTMMTKIKRKNYPEVKIVKIDKKISSANKQLLDIYFDFGLVLLRYHPTASRCS